MLSIKFSHKLIQLIFALGIAVAFWFAWVSVSQAASFAISPSGGTYTVGSTFEVSILVDTKGQDINAVQMNLSFPADKLQLVSPSAGSSIIEIYTAPPRYDNAKGQIEIVGGIPNGINVSAGLISKLTFRVKGVGTATLRFAGESQVLLNDGRGTNVLDNTFGASYKLELPAQQGPIVISDTHPDQEIWYRSASANLQWDIGFPAADNYSYTISDNPTDIPDDTPETAETFASYKQVSEGINYFHIKAFRDGRWGGVSHYSLRIDTSSPANFPIVISPNARTFITTPFIQFNTTDSRSGLDRYELKIIPLKIQGRPGAVVNDQLFVDAQSPYIVPELLRGSYEVIIRAYDKAGNIREVSQKLEITDSWFWFVSQDGLALPFGKQASWRVVIAISLLFIILLFITAYLFRHWYLHYHRRIENNHLPNTIQTQLDELQKYRSRYGKIASIFLALLVTSWLILAPSTTQVKAAELVPPVIGSYSSNIKDDELFYVTGRTQKPNNSVVVHLQSLVDGGAFDFSINSDQRGDWIYRHDDFLAGGQYIIWASTKDGEQLSAPSPQVTMDVKPVAISWGGTRITYQSIYLGVILALAMVVVVLVIYIIVHALLVRRRRKQFGEQLRRAEDSIKRGFIILRRDIEAELLLIKQANLSEQLSGEQKVHEEQLRQDLKSIEDVVGREIWEVETFESLPTQ